jgi:hypothetical protein
MNSGLIYRRNKQLPIFFFVFHNLVKFIFVKRIRGQLFGVFFFQREVYFFQKFTVGRKDKYFGIARLLFKSYNIKFMVCCIKVSHSREAVRQVNVFETILAYYENKPRRHAKGREKKMDIKMDCRGLIHQTRV